MYAMRQPGAVKRAEHLKGLAGAVVQRPRRYGVRGSGPNQFDVVRA